MTSPGSWGWEVPTGCHTKKGFPLQKQLGTTALVQQSPCMWDKHLFFACLSCLHFPHYVPSGYLRLWAPRGRDFSSVVKMLWKCMAHYRTCLLRWHADLLSPLRGFPLRLGLSFKNHLIFVLAAVDTWQWFLQNRGELWKLPVTKAETFGPSLAWVQAAATQGFRIFLCLACR